MRHERKKHRQRSVVEKLENRWLLNGDLKGTVVDQSNNNAGIGGVTIFIDADNDRKLDSGEISVVSDSAGVFQFSNLPEEYDPLREIVPEGYELVDQPFAVVVIDGVVRDVGAFVNIHYWIIRGTSGDDVITVEGDPGGARVTVNGVAEVHSLDTIKAIILRGGDGNDRITVDSQLQFITRIFGDPGNDTLFGGPLADSIFGGSGDDSIKGGAGNDSIGGDAGNDRISAGDGNDSIKGGAGRNLIHGGAGDDVIQASGTSDAGNSTVYGEGGKDSIVGGPRNDSLFGGDGDDSLWGMKGIDRLIGGTGNDFLNSADFSSKDLIWGGSGSDMLLRDHADQWSGVEHERIPKASHHEPSFFCFLTSAVVHWAGKADDCHELTVLRRFRDGYMRQLPQGPQMIQDYYEHAPRVVRAIEEQALGEVEWPKVHAMVQEAVRLIEAGRDAEALELYSAEYLRLKAEYVQVALV